MPSFSAFSASICEYKKANTFGYLPLIPSSPNNPAVVKKAMMQCISLAEHVRSNFTIITCGLAIFELAFDSLWAKPDWTFQDCLATWWLSFVSWLYGSSHQNNEREWNWRSPCTCWDCLWRYSTQNIWWKKWLLPDTLCPQTSVWSYAKSAVGGIWRMVSAGRQRCLLFGGYHLYDEDNFWLILFNKFSKWCKSSDNFWH